MKRYRVELISTREGDAHVLAQSKMNMLAREGWEVVCVTAGSPMVLYVTFVREE